MYTMKYDHITPPTHPFRTYSQLSPVSAGHICKGVGPSAVHENPTVHIPKKG